MATLGMTLFIFLLFTVNTVANIFKFFYECKVYCLIGVAIGLSIYFILKKQSSLKAYPYLKDSESVLSGFVAGIPSVAAYSIFGTFEFYEVPRMDFILLCFAISWTVTSVTLRLYAWIKSNKPRPS